MTDSETGYRTQDVRGEGAPADRTRSTERIRIEQHGAAGMIWVAGWLFSVGFLHLPFWKAVLALIIWPYYLGSALTPL